MTTTPKSPLRYAEDRDAALEIIAASYRGPLKYAKAVLERWPRAHAIVAIAEGQPAAAEIYYLVELAKPTCVHYYIAVAPHHRRRGIATQLVKTVEQLCGAPVYMATTTLDNQAATALFTKLGYTPYQWREIPRHARETLLKATCGYDDDILLIKGAHPTEAARHTPEVETLWRETCYKPYIGL
ncbi:GNAT family N-acetyltransferase [Pyrobaculum sp. 3827-6]|uniref:GNAT family N-acetyltransferase n=1 Tax=Pyrobaculum sp. 3827-6 TaxID=2983604 RepID=UPI0021DB7638|nr:GNAT family N-acetyltransferase [Pyrobaculum sp. 3827-6]MCU7787299.1 GNAT family N-acetyltransferase [Pyrobaculum sp. 3827-6]